jgi:hypothetical protein
MTMTDTISDTVHRGQGAYADAMQRWVDSVHKIAGSLPTPDAKAVDEVVDNYFAIAEQVLVAQRKVAKGVLAAATSLAANAVSTAQGAANNAAGGQKS